jgi:hypothetical protein
MRDLVTQYRSDAVLILAEW